MILTVGKTRGFVIEGMPNELRIAATMPGAVYRKGEGIVRMPENLASWKALREAEFDIVDSAAHKALRSLRDSYRDHRRRVRNATRRFKLTGETDIPVPLISIPMEHQVRAFGFCSELDESALFMDMGTGKTLVAIALAIHRAKLAGGQFRVLVICPKAVKPVWPKELAKHTNHPHSIAMDSVPSTDEDLQIWVTNYDRVKREQRRMLKWRPDMIILDESHRIKNRKSDRTKAVMGLKSVFRLIMSGSPIGKCITEAWSQISFLKKDIFGSYTQFRDRYLKMGGYMSYKVVGYKNEDEFADKLHSVAFRVTKDECLDLPPLSYQRLYVEPDKKTHTVYNEMDLNYFFEQDGEEVSVDREATKQMKLRQIVGGLVKSDAQELVHVSNLKAQALEELLEGRTQDKTIVFFSFTHEIEIAKAICKKLGIGFLTLQGSTNTKDRNEFETRFQEDPTIGAALIQIATGAEGMTLTAADVSVFYSPTFSYIGYSQARDRPYRKGQTRPVTIIFIIMAGTVDERVVDVLESNRQLTDTYMDTKRNYTMATKKAAPAPEKEAPAKTGYTAADLAGELGIEPAELRKHLRALGTEKPADSWTWPNAKAAAEVKKAVAAHIKELANKPAAEKAPAKKEADAPKLDPQLQRPKPKPVRKATKPAAK
jgi:SNF2 family DNA or RNA helicase